MSNEQLQKQAVVISELKSEVYDLSKELQNANAIVKQFHETLAIISQKLDIQPNENGQIDLEVIVDTVPNLVPKEDIEENNG